MANKSLGAAKNAKNDEFYTQFSDIQKEIEAYLEFDANAFRGKVVTPIAMTLLRVISLDILHLILIA